MNQSLGNPDFIKGEILLFDKALDWTSFDVVNRVRYMLCRKLQIKKLKVGHAGTLDPKASGLVILCTGKATKKIESIQSTEKEYLTTIKLGATTPSYDLESEEDQTFPIDHIHRAFIEETLKQFEGEIDQVPPVFSAVKINGKRAFNYAREGEEVKMKSRKVQIHKIEIESFEAPYLKLKIRCGKGTYIRSLARDIGLALKSGGYLVELRRTLVGVWTVEKAWNMKDFEKSLSELKLS